MDLYLEILDEIKNFGNVKSSGRADMPDTIQKFGEMMQIDLAEGFPLYTSKKLSFANIMHELNWFIKGHTSVKYLEYHKCRIWHDDSYAYYKRLALKVLECMDLMKASLNNSPVDISEEKSVKEYFTACDIVLKALFTPDDELKKFRILTKQEYKAVLKNWGDEQRINNLSSYELDLLIVEKTVHGFDRTEVNNALSYVTSEEDITYDFGDCGAQYGYLWRNLLTVDRNHNIKRVDQFAALVEGLKNNPYGRRHIINSWNVGTLNDMALNACHPIVQFDVTKMEAVNGEDANHLSCAFFMRSNDMFLGNPYNIAFYALLTNVLAGILGYEVGTLTWFCGDAHVYSDHVEQVEELVERTPRDLPTFDYKKLSGYGVSDILSVYQLLHIDSPEYGVVTYPNGESLYNGFDDHMQILILNSLYNYNPHPAIKANLSTGN